MRAAKKAFLNRVFESLGADRVEAGLATKGHAWDDCFLACATGSDAERQDLPRSVMALGRFYAPLLGFAPGIVYEVVRLWDRDETGFRAMAREWLEMRDESPPPPSRHPTLSLTGSGT